MQITPQQSAVVSGSATRYEETPVAWVAYPDARCYQVDIFYMVDGGNVLSSSHRMRPMGSLDVSYAFFGFGNALTPGASSIVEQPENASFDLPSSLFVSKINNPFVFPAENTITFTAGRIMNLAAVTIPLSDGQVGQFDLYVFTDEGIFALKPDSEGVFRSEACVSRDILLSRDSLVGIEQGVFFAAARGLCLLRGITVTKVSDAIEGAVSGIDGELAGRIAENHFAGMPIEAAQPFSRFLKDCRIAYDYASTRIILTNDAYKAMYVYKFDTQTWHRLDMGLGSPVRVLNAFPEALIVTSSDNGQSVYNFSVLLESEDAEVAPGLIVTRPFDLGEPDVRKAIRDLRIRGMFNRGDARYILLGSFDGMHWKQLSTLHGGSYKMFRMVIVTNLAPNERISWVDFDFDTRFTNKLR